MAVCAALKCYSGTGGAVIWHITTGDGAFAGVTEYITSNFTVSAEGEVVVDNHYVRILLP
jgi:hypothetical protein